MADIYLQGSEQVAQAGRNIVDAAQTIDRAVNNLTERLDSFQRFMNEWIERLEQTAGRDGS